MTFITSLFKKTIKIICLIFILNSTVKAQCTTGSGNSTITPIITWQTMPVTPGTIYYVTFAATAGVSYTFTYCDGGGSYTGDPYLTISDNVPVGVASNDDFCGLGSNIFWTCATTGIYRVYFSGCCPCALPPSATLAYRASVTPIPATPCAGAPDANSVITPSYQVCPGVSLPISLAASYTVNGITYQWQASTVSNVGPFTAIAGATLATYTTSPLMVQTYFNCIITCTNSNQNITATVGVCNVAGTTTNTAPYFDGFESVGLPNLLPNCSWAASALGGACQTYTGAATGNRSARTGSKFAVFNSASGVFYTNGIYLQAGVTYSTAVWYKTEAVSNFQNWSNLSIKLGPNQSAVGSFNLASTLGSAASGPYKSLSNTFTVSSSGIYYVAVSATYSGAGAPYLVWDDLEITVPCNLNPSNLQINATASLICQGQSITISASGGSSYLWNNGSTNPSIIVSPQQNTTYTVTSTSSLSGCSSSITKFISVNISPIVLVLTPNSTICAGASANLQAAGANNYVWGNGLNSANISVSPLVSTTYSVFGTNSFGCSGTGSQLITVNPIPVVTAIAISPKICLGENAMLSGSGALTYAWSSASSFLQGNPVTVSPNASTVYTVTGSANGCNGNAFVSVEVMGCVGFNALSFNANGVKVYPNPSHGEFTLELNNGLVNSIELIDLTGRVISTTGSIMDKTTMNINHLSNGIYYLKIKSAESTSVVKIIKN